MKPFLPFQAPMSPAKIKAGSPVYSQGSCFADNWGGHLIRHGWPCLSNPMGIVYNPESLLRQMQYIFGEEQVSDREWFEHEHLWHHFDFHGSQSHPSHPEAIDQLKRKLHETRSFLKKAEHCILTLGTAHVFIHKDSGRIVNNCHKLPASHFEQRMLSVEECTTSLQQIRELLLEHSKCREFIWTVSPVRHVRRGLIENNRSKARLVLAVEEISSRFEDDYYFPSYEMLIDVWRDHRFFKEDKVHPTEEILGEIYEAFVRSTFDTEAESAWRELKTYYSMKSHKVLHPGRPEAKAWQDNLHHHRQRLKEKYPWVGLD